jgi:hypothetical protein
VVGWSGCARSQFFMVCWKRSALPQVVGWFGREFFWTTPRTREFVLEAGAAASSTGESGGVDEAVVGQGGGRDSVCGNGCAEAGQHDGSGDPGVGGDREGEPRAVVEPGQDLHISTRDAFGAGEPVVGEVGLPGLVRQLGLEPDVGGFRALLRLGGDQAGPGQVAADGGHRHHQGVVPGQVPGDGVGSGVQARGGELLAQLDDQSHGGLGKRGWAFAGAPRPWHERCLPLGPVAGHQLADPTPRDAVPVGDLGLGTTLDDNRCDDQSGFRHQ